MKPVKLLLIGLGLLGIVVVLLAVIGGRPSSHPGVKRVFGRGVGEVKVQPIGDFHVESAVTDFSAGEALARLRDKFGIQGRGVYGDSSRIHFGPFFIEHPTMTSVEETNLWLQSMLVTRKSGSHVMFYWTGGGNLSNTPAAAFAGELPMPDGTTGMGNVGVPPHPSATAGSSVSANTLSTTHHHSTNELDAVWEHYTNHFQLNPVTHGREPVGGEGNGFKYLLVPDPGVPGVRSRGLIVSRTNQITAVFLIRAGADTNTHIMTTVVK